MRLSLPQRVFAALTRRFSYGLAVVIFSNIAPAAMSLVFIYFAIEAVQLKTSDLTRLTLLILCGLPWLTHPIQFGLFAKWGLPGFPASVARINRAVQVSHRAVTWQRGLSTRQLRQLMRDISRMPVTNTLTALAEVAVIGLGFLVASLTLDLDNLGIFFIFMGTAIGAFLYAGVCYILSELVTGPLRKRCKRLLGQRDRGDRAAHLPVYSTIRYKLVLYLILLGIGLSLTMVLVYYNRDNLPFILAFSFVCFVVSLFLAWVLFRTIYSSLDEIQQAARQMALGKNVFVYPSSLDREWDMLARSINTAAHSLREYQVKLEKKVAERTRELANANDKLAESNSMVDMEIRIAAEIQRGVIPGDLITWRDRARLFGVWEPLSQISGDYFDVLNHPDHLYFWITDVSGHGVPAALITMLAKQAFQDVLYGAIRKSPEKPQALSPARIFHKLNNILNLRIQTQDYLTAYLCHLAPDGTLTFAGAGHPPALWYHKSTRTVDRLVSEGLFLGALSEDDLSEAPYREGQVKLEPGDRVILYTDGIVEQEDPHQDPFGFERLLEVCANTGGESVEKMAGKLAAAVAHHRLDSPPVDDLSLLICGFEPR